MRDLRGAEARSIIELFALTDGWLARECEVSVSTVNRWWANDTQRVPLVLRLLIGQVVSDRQRALEAIGPGVHVAPRSANSTYKRTLGGMEMPHTFWRALYAEAYLASPDRVSIVFTED